MIEIDGSILEGGGQILRTAISLSAITQKPCHIFNIRKNRPKPGLAPQHLLGMQALAEFCNGRLEGDSIGSEDIKFYPGQAKRKQISINIPTAGSITLILQTLLPIALFSAISIDINIDGGATDTFFSPTIDHFRLVFLKILERMGARVKIDILNRGYYPEGGARVKANILPSKPASYRNRVSGAGLKNLNSTERGSLEKILAISGASEFLKNKKVAERQLAGMREILGKLKLPLEEKSEYYQTNNPGSHICLMAEFKNTIIGADNLGKLGKRAEDIGKEAALALLKEEKSGASFDKHTADQILPYMALAGGQGQATVSEITDHCKTNIWVIERFLDGRFKTENNLISWSQKD